MLSRAGAHLSRPAAVAARTLSEVAAFLGLPVRGGAGGEVDPDTLVSGITHDSREVRGGDLYAALPGAHVHGATFAAAAVQAGAVAVLTDPDGMRASGPLDAAVFEVERPRERLGKLSAFIYGEPAADLHVVGITGTNGKTTTAFLIDAGFRAAGLVTGILGTVETRVGDQVLTSVRTTPEAPELQALLAIMRERGARTVTMEVSSHALAQGRVDAVLYDIAVFTNLSEDHLDFHGDLASYFRAKASLFTSARTRRAVVDIDDEYGRKIVERADVPVTTVSAAGRPDAHWRAADVRHAAAGSSFTVIGPGLSEPASVAMPGEFNVSNALLAITALAAADVPVATAIAAVSEFGGVPGRMERVDAGQDFLALVDYAHTPDAVARVLASLRATGAGSLIVVLGCGGDRDRIKRAPMGAAAAGAADLCILTSDNPRSEDPGKIVAAIEAGARSVPEDRRAEIVVETDRRAAIAIAVHRARAGDTVAVLGKGHESGQEIAGVVRPFDDRVELAKAIRAASAPSGTAP